MVEKHAFAAGMPGWHARLMKEAIVSICNVNFAIGIDMHQASPVVFSVQESGTKALVGGVQGSQRVNSSKQGSLCNGSQFTHGMRQGVHAQIACQERRTHICCTTLG